MSNPKIELPTGYYHTNFCHILQNGLDRYSDLLSASELGFAVQFFKLPLDAQRIYVRLVSRTGPWFRADKLKYPELESLPAALHAALAAGYLLSEHEASVEELLNLTNLDELKTILRLAAGGRKGAVPAGMRKDDLMATALEAVPRDVLKQNIGSLFEAYSPSKNDLLRTYFLLFFGNLSQDATEFVLQDLGVVVYEKYSLEKELRLFQTRESIDHRLHVASVRDEVFELLEAQNLEQACKLALELSASKSQLHSSVQRRACKVLNDVARELERAKRPQEALELYLNSGVQPARERAVRLYEKAALKVEAQALALEMLEHPQDEPERQFAQKFLKRTLELKFEVCEPEVRTFELARKYGQAIESQLIAQLHDNGMLAYFTENHLWNSLFGVAFWDVIFAPVAGVFAHPFQRGPLDLYSSEFAKRRGALLHQRIDEIRSGNFGAAQFLQVFDTKFGTANNFVFWADGVREQLEAALTRLSAPQLAGVLERMAFDIRRFGNGFPDLFVCLPQSSNPTSQKFELWEVKGPGDTLRPEQKTWIAFFATLGICVCVARVVWKG